MRNPLFGFGAYIVFIFFSMDNDQVLPSEPNMYVLVFVICFPVSHVVCNIQRCPLSFYVQCGTFYIIMNSELAKITDAHIWYAHPITQHFFTHFTIIFHLDELKCTMSSSDFHFYWIQQPSSNLLGRDFFSFHQWQKSLQLEFRINFCVICTTSKIHIYLFTFTIWFMLHE